MIVIDRKTGKSTSPMFTQEESDRIWEFLVQKFGPQFLAEERARRAARESDALNDKECVPL